MSLSLSLSPRCDYFIGKERFLSHLNGGFDIISRGEKQLNERKAKSTITVTSRTSGQRATRLSGGEAILLRSPSGGDSRAVTSSRRATARCNERCGPGAARLVDRCGAESSIERFVRARCTYGGDVASLSTSSDCADCRATYICDVLERALREEEYLAR